jgi:hypothetical protein
MSHLSRRLQVAVAAFGAVVCWPAYASAQVWQPVGAGIVNAGKLDDPVETVHHMSGRMAQAAWTFDAGQQKEVLWMGASHGGLWKSTVDASGTIVGWTPLTENFPGSHTLGSFVVHPLDSNRILIGTGSSWGDGDGIYGTADGGASWAATVLPGVVPKHVWRLVADRDDAKHDTVFAATGTGLWRTTTFGAAWSRVLRPINSSGVPQEVTDVIQDARHAATWYAGAVDIGIQYSTDGGMSWCALGDSFSGGMTRISLAASGRFVYALVIGSDRALNGVFRLDTGDTGVAACSGSKTAATWEIITTAAVKTALDNTAQGAHTASIAADPNAPAHLFIGLATMGETTNATANPTTNVQWTTSTSAIDGGHHDTNHMLFLPDGHTIVFANDGGYYLADFSLTPHVIDDSGNRLGINVTELTSKNKVGQGRLAVAHSNPDVIGAGMQDNGTMVSDGAGELTLIGSGDGGAFSFHPDDPTHLAFSTTILVKGTGGHRFISMDAGDTSISVDTGALDLKGDSRSTMLIDPTPDGVSTLVFTHSDGTSKADDPEGTGGGDETLHPANVWYRPFGDTTSAWLAVSPSTVPNSIAELDHTTNPQLHTLVATLVGDTRLFVYTGPRSVIGTLTLQERTPPLCSSAAESCTLPAPGDARTNADPSSLQPDTIYYTTGTGRPRRAFMSVDAGLTWKEVTGDLPGELDLFRLVANPKNVNQLFIATSRGVFRSLDGGTHWTDYSKGLRLNETVQDLVMSADHADPARLTIATQGRGFWARPLNNHAPALVCGPPVVNECAGPQTPLTFSTHVDDSDGDELKLTWQVDGVIRQITTVAALATPIDAAFVSGYSKGAHVVSVTAEDGQTTASCTTAVTIADTRAPLVNASLVTNTLWPANQNLVNVGLQASAVDRCEGAVPVTLAVTSDEDDVASGGGGTFSPDATDLAPGALRLRAERVSNSDGRVYLVAVRAQDESGNLGSACATAVVPLNQSAASLAAVAAQAVAATAACPATPVGYVVVGNGAVVGPKR